CCFPAAASVFCCCCCVRGSSSSSSKVRAGWLLLQEGKETPVSVSLLLGAPVVQHVLPSGGLLYAAVGLSLADLAVGYLPYLPLLCRFAAEGGTLLLPPELLLPLAARVTGGLSAAVSFRLRPDTPFTVPRPYNARGLFLL